MNYSTGLDHRTGEQLERDATADAASLPAGDPFRKIAALAYARWESLRDNADLPAISRSHTGEARLYTPNCVQVAWDHEVSTPTIPYLGNELAGELARISGESWPNVPIENPLIGLLQDISQRAIDAGDTTEFDERIADSEGWIREYRGVALPFAGSETGTFLVDLIFDLDNPIPTTAPAESQLRTQSDTGDVLLLEQELDPDDMPRLAIEPPPPPVLFVCVSDEHRMPRPPLARGREKRKAPEAEPLLLTEGHEIQAAPADSLRHEAPPAARPATNDTFILSLEAAREQAAAASGSEERSHLALYSAIGAAYDFALSATAVPERLEEAMAQAGLKAQARAPMTPIVKLIFGADYDRTRLAEYAAALSHALRKKMPAGSFANYLLDIDGGLKGIVKAERQLRRKAAPAKKSPLARIEKKLRETPVQTFGNFEPEGQEFTLVIARRMADGSVALVGEVPQDERLFCTAARKFLTS
jgi:hypothetical protein